MPRRWLSGGPGLPVAVPILWLISWPAACLLLLLLLLLAIVAASLRA
jgi:hypothetical protein